MESESLLKLKNVSVNYGGVHALSDVSISVDAGEIIAIMGPNGAGKSTVLKSIFGLANNSKGEVLWHEKVVDPKPYEMVARGVSYAPQGRQVFRNLTVYENLELGGYALPNKKDLKSSIEEVLNFFPDLKEKLNHKAGSLSGGQQQMLTIARGLVSDPNVLLLDEPTLGLSPKVVKEVFEKIVEINKLRKIAVVIVEHSVQTVLSVSHRVYVLAHGKIAYDGTPESLSKDNTLQKIFLSV